MDWLSLQRSPLWRGLLESDELAAKKKALLDLLLNGTWDETTLGEIRGQLKMLKHIETLVDTCAAKQAREEQREGAKVEMDPRVAALLNQTPNIV